MPPELDDLINSIREEASRESALAIYEGTRQDDLVDEEIDERILNLLGLDDTFDIDYKTYMTLLKERMAAARMTDSQIPTEESELITEEFKRVKRKVGRFKIKTKKISVDSFQKNAINPSKLLTGSALAEEPKEEKTPRKKKVDDIIKIRETVVSIKNLLEKRNDQLKDSAETERSRAQKAKRAKREDKLEEKKPNLGLKALEKAVAPVKGLFDRIVSGLVTLIAGRFLVKFLDWFSDPDNKEKVDSVIQFLTDFAPAILGSFLLFGTGFGRIIRKLIGVAVKMTAKLLKFAVPKLLKFVAKNPVAAAAIGVGGAAIVGGIMQSNTQSNDPDAPEGRTQLEDTMDYGGVTGDPVAGAFETGGLVPFKGDDSNLPKEQKGQKQQGKQKKGNPLLNLLGMTPIGMALKGASSLFDKDPARDITGNSGTDVKGAGVDTQLISASMGDVVINKEAASAVGPNYFDAISQKSGEKVTGAGPDTQMIAVRPGEIVVNKETVDSVGADHFLGLNKLFGGAGANKPKTAKVQTASGGGVVLPTFSSGGMVGGYESSHDHSKEGNSASNRENQKLLKERGKDIKEEKKEEKEINKISSGSLEATLAREDAAVEKALAKEKSTGKVVGRENLPAATQKILAEMDVKRSGTLPPDIKTTKKGGMPDMGLGGLIRGVLGTGAKQKEEKKYGANLADGANKVMSAIENPLSIFGMFGGGEKKIVDGNIGKPTAQEQKDFDALAANKEKLKQSQQKLMGLEIPKKSSQDDSALRAEYNKIQDDPKHPLFEKVRGGGDIDDFGMRFSEFKDFKAKESGKEKVKSTFQLAGSSEVIDLNKPMGSEIKRKDFPSTRSGAKAYQTAMRNMKAGAEASIASLPKDYKKKESVDARHAQLMKSTDPQKISNYDAEHGEGAYSKKLLGKLKNTYADASAAEMKKAVNFDPKSPIIPSKAKTFVAGEVKENSGQDLKGKTADRQRIDAEPGEYVLPKESVQKLGGPDKIDNVVAKTDPNSTPAKMGEKSVTLQPPSAPSRKPMITNLPPTVQKSGGGGDSGGGMEMAGNNPPSIPMISNPTRERNKMIYGINEGG